MSNYEKRRRTLREIKSGLAKKSLAFKNIFDTDDGKMVLSALETEFMFKDLAEGDSTTIVVNAAQADVVRYIHLMMNFQHEETNDE